MHKITTFSYNIMLKMAYNYLQKTSQKYFLPVCKNMIKILF